MYSLPEWTSIGRNEAVETGGEVQGIMVGLELPPFLAAARRKHRWQ